MGSEQPAVYIEKLGRYEVVRTLGQGAMGVVYEGRDPNLDRRVAIKTIRVQNHSAEAAVEYDKRFKTEARSAARLQHPNIVNVFDSGQDEGISYLVMEFIQGEDLKDHLKRGVRFSVGSSISIVHDLLMALDHAHRQNVVHRDVKPANILIEQSGRIKLTDFGVARIQDPDETHLTQMGGAVGTPKYMSPEQAKGLRGDSRSDVFSAAIVLYELLTGKLPFEGDNQFVVIHQIVSQDPAPPSGLNPQVPVAMDEIMARAMAKNPDERYATAREFALALRTLAQHMEASPGAQATDVAEELGQFLVHRQSDNPAGLRDGSSTGILSPGTDVALETTINFEDELGLWSKVKDSLDPKDYQWYLQRFPAGIYARRAQLRLDQLVQQANTASRTKIATPAARPAAKPQIVGDFDATMGPTVSAPHASSPVVSDTPLELVPMPAKAQSAEAAVAQPQPVISESVQPSHHKSRLAFMLLGGLASGILITLFFVVRPKNTPDVAGVPVGSPVVVTMPAASPVPAVPVVSAPAVSAPSPAEPVETIISSTPAVPAALPVSQPTVAVSSRVPAPAVVALPLPSKRPAAVSDNTPAPPAVTIKPKAVVVAPARVLAPPPENTVAAPPARVLAPPPPDPEPATAQRNAPAPVTNSSGNAPGPTQPGQACADKNFFGRMVCLAAQCRKDPYRQTAECVHFNSMQAPSKAGHQGAG